MTLLDRVPPALGFLFACSVKATVLLVLTILTVSLLRRRSAALRHQAWAVGILASLALPVLTFLLPAWHSAALSDAAGFLSLAHPVAAHPYSQSLPSMVVDAASASPLLSQLRGWLVLSWAAGALLIVLRLLGGLARTTWVSAHSVTVTADDWAGSLADISKSLEIARRVPVLLCSNPAAMPVTWGVFRPRIILPAGATEWSSDRRRIVLTHELAHIARQDWPAQICAELFRAFYWFHPLAWIAAARLRQESERACDDTVLNSGLDACDYANQLLELARTLKSSERSWSVALAIARPSHLERRFLAMLNPCTNRRGVSPRAGRFAKLVALVVLLPLAGVRLPAQNLSGKFTGTIFDVSGAAVPNATIVMTSHRAKTIDMTASGAEGNFSFKALPAGEYEMKVLKPRFDPYRAPQIVLEPNRDLSLNIRLDIEAISEVVDVPAEGAAQTPASAESAEKSKPTRLPIGGNVQAARILQKVQPVYPDAARTSSVEGTVVLHAVIGMDGKPLSLQVMNSQVDPQLARAAIEAVSQWRYAPTLLNGEPIEIDTTISVNFRLLP
jgi:TonB family protein